MRKIAIKPNFKQDGIKKVMSILSGLNPTKGYLVKIYEDNPVRTSPQNRYYRGVVVEQFRKGLLDQGVNIPHDVAHEVLLCAAFGKNEIDVKGKKFTWPVRRTTTDEYGNNKCITVAEMVNFIDKSIAYAAELGIEIDESKKPN